MLNGFANVRVLWFNSPSADRYTKQGEKMAHECLKETPQLDTAKWSSREFQILKEHCVCDHEKLSAGINKWIELGKPNSDTPNWKLAIQLLEEVK